MAESFLDKVIAYWAPAKAAKRAYNKAVYEKYRNYDGSSKGRRTDGWETSSSSANTEIKKGLALLRERTRDQDRNNPYVKKAINTIRNNAAGMGIRLSIPESIPNRENILADWNKWANNRKACDFEEHLNFYAIQALATRTMSMSGEVLVIRKKPQFKKGAVPLQLLLLEADYLDTNKDTDKLDKGGKISQGIEYYANGKRKGYWLYKQHPGDENNTSSESVFVLAKDVIHLFEKDRPGQERGVPMGTPSMTQLKDLKDYQDFELLKQKGASCYTAFVKKDNPNQEEFESSEGELTEKLEPGLIQYLTPGEEVIFANPPSTTGYGEHTKRLLQGSATGWGVTYESMTGDLSMVNYSSFRGGWLEFQRQVQHLQYNVIVPILCDTVFEWWLEAASIAGILPKDTQIIPSWTAPRREMIDPSKEITAIKEAVKGGIMSLSEAARETGWDPNELLAEIKADQEKLTKMNIKIDTDIRNEIPPAAPKTTEPGTKKPAKKTTKPK